MHTLIVMRHAQAAPNGPTDFERELTPRGLGDAVAVGKRLQREGLTPDLALVSSAARTRQTWENVAVGAGWDLGCASYSADLYGAEVQDWWNAVHGLDEAVGTVVLIGHNPTIAELVEAEDYPTATATVLECEGPWNGTGLSVARIASVIRP